MQRCYRVVLRPGCFLLAAFLVSFTTQADQFVKIANDGQRADSGAALGGGASDWACTHDDARGLMWEVKTAEGGLRDRRWTYTPYDSNPATNGGWEGYRDDKSGECLRSSMDNRSCNTEAYVVAVNRAKLCGYDDWRLPTVSELMQVAHETDRENPAATDQLLPNTADGWYWTGVTRVGITAFSRVVLLPSRGRPHFYDGSYMVLVVRNADEEKN